MSDQLFDQAVRKWLDDGSDRTPPTAIDAVLLAVKTTPQERGLRVPWRFSQMSSTTRLAAAVGFLALAGLVGYGIVGGGSRPAATASPVPTASPRPSPSPTVRIVSNGALAPGTYAFDAPLPITVTVPTGWSAFAGLIIDKNYDSTASGAGAALGVWEITNRYVDPCASPHVLLSPVPGPGIDELLAALASQPGIQAGPVADVTVDGYVGKSVELTVTKDIDTCGFQGFWLWWGGDRRYVQNKGEVDRIYALDVDGIRHTFFARISPRTTPADRAELEGIIASIDIAP